MKLSFKRSIAFALSSMLFFQSTMGVNAAVYTEKTSSDKTIENIWESTNTGELLFAEENGEVSISANQTVSQNQLEKEHTEDEREATISQNDIEEQGENKDRTTQAAEDEKVSKEETTQLEDVLLNFLYVEIPYLETPATQHIAAEVTDAALELEKAVLTYKNYKTDAVFEIEGDIEENLIIFEKNFTDDETGIYEVCSLTIYSGGQSKVINMEEAGIDAYFGVNEEVVRTTQENDISYELETNVVTIDEKGVANAATSIEEAIEAASESGTDSLARAKGTDGNIVIVLDPGHDNTHAGARNTSGLKEEELTLKIAQYCKEELENYDGITLYMTRSTSVCPHPGTTSVVCNSNRVAYAKSVGADVYVSFHLNTAAATSASGAEVYYPNGNYNATIGSQGKELANQIQQKLVALGLNNRGIKIMYSQDGSTYPDGSLADYYGVIKNSKLNGFPGIIIEHAFLSNASDASNFLSSEEGLKKLGVADAQGIVANYSLVKKGEGTEFKTGDIIVSNVDNLNGSFQVSINSITPAKKVSKVQFNVYTKSDKSDLKVYNTKNMADGSYQATVSASKHNNAEGTYIIEAKIVDTNGNSTIATSTTQTLLPSFKAKLSAELTGTNNTKFKVSATGIADAASVEFLFYYKKDGQAKGVTYKAKKDKNGVWYYNIPVKTMEKEGKYRVHVYATAAYGTKKQAAVKNFNYERETTIAVKAVNAKQKKFRVTTGGLAYASKVEYEVYSKTGGKDDLKTYKAKKNSDGIWTYDVQVNKHKTEGKYYVTVYATVNGKKMKVGKKNFNVSGPTDAKTTVSVNSAKATMAVTIKNLSAPSGIKNVKVKVWTKKDKSDAKWFTAKKSKANYKVTIKQSKFSYYYGKYYLEVYATDNNKIEKKVSSYRKTIKQPEVEVGAVWNKAETKLKVTVADVSFAKSMEVRVWSKTAGKKATKKYKAKKDSKGVWVYNIKSSSFTEKGRHYIKAYAQIGGKSYLVGSKTIQITNVDKPVQSGYYTIMGESDVTLNQLISYYQANATYPSYYAGSDASTLKKFCQIYMEECEDEGVKVEVAFVQAMKETNFLKYGGDVSIEQYNFAGIGATGGGVKGNSFADVRTGIRAQVQHLKAYASTEALVHDVVDPRFSYVKRGICPYVEWLGINENPNKVGWAADVGYGTDIVKRIGTLKSY